MDFFINDKQVELGPKTKIALTYQANNIAELQDRQGTLTNKFKVPKTNVNNATLENSDQLTSLTDIPYKRNTARINHGGIDVIPNGFAILDDQDDNYNIRVYAGNATLKEDLKDKFLTNLDLSQWNHTWDKATAINSRTNTDGYIYALINFVDDTLLSFFEIPTFWYFLTSRARPSFFIYRLILEIFDQNGWNLIIPQNVLNNPEFRAELLPMNNKELKISGGTGFFSALKTSDQLIVRNIGSTGQQELIAHTDDSSGAPNAFDTGNNYDPAWIGIGRYTIPFSGTYTFQTTQIIESTTSFARTIDIILFDTFGNVATQAVTQTGIATTTNVFTHTAHFNAGDNINIITRLGGNSAQSDFINIKAGGTFKCTNIVPDGGTVAEGGIFDISLNMPEISQWDLVKDFMQRYCLIPQTDELTKTVKMFHFRDVFANVPNAKDLSAKHINISKDKKEFHPTTYAQKNLLLYGKNDKFVGDSSGNFLIADESLAEEKTMFTSIFQEINTGYFYNNFQQPYTGLYLDGSPHVVKLKMIPTPSKEVIYQSFLSGDTSVFTDLPATYFVNPNEPYDLSFKSLVEQHYQELIAILTKYKKVNSTIRWDPADLSELQFDIPYYLKKYQAFFYLNKITNWLPDVPPLTELIRIL
ncbi:MAG TPA: hypothetical protein VJY62_02460 [Bacteroidia bacterium]|nr:hypothetical protein [Bacteroidia bacterium]